MDGKLDVFISYFDESESKDKHLVLVAAVLLKEPGIRKGEEILAYLREFEVPENHQGKFSEFHTADLYNSRGIFKDVPQDRARHLIEQQAQLISQSEVNWLYAFVDVRKHAETVFGNAKPLTVAFRKCLLMMEERLSSVQSREMALPVFDEPSNGDTRRELQIAFRNLRKPLNTVIDGSRGKLNHFHDDLYFGSSAFSVGLQIADLCAYFARRHEERKRDTEHIFEMLSGLLITGTDALAREVE